MVNIANLFVNDEEVISVNEWYSRLSRNAAIYNGCVVKTLTHVKNLRSSVAHEYLQIIVEQTDTGRRTRIIAERQNTQDQVIVGRQAWGSSSSSGGGFWRIFSGSSSSSSSSSANGIGDLPLPLYSLKFASDDFQVIRLARILYQTTRAGGKYSLLSKNCYWFARTVYESAKQLFTYSEEPWYWASMKGTPLRWIGHITSQNQSAGKFAQEREQHMRYAPGEANELRQWLESIYTEVIKLNVEDNVAAKAIQQESMPGWVSDDLENLSKLAENQPSTENIPLRATADEIVKLDDSDEYRKIFDEHDAKAQDEREGATIEPELRDFPSVVNLDELPEEDSEQVEQAIKVLVGFVLAEYGKMEAEAA